MKRLISIVAFMILFLVASTTIYATEVEPRFENYKWGSSLDEVKEIVTSKGHRMLLQHPPSSLPSIIYSDRILCKEVTILFVFTPKTQKLCSINLNWEDATSVGRSLLRILTEKYGEPSRPNQFIEQHWWGLSIRLEFGFWETDLTYYSKKYIAMYMQEESEIEDTEAEDKF